MRPNLRIPLILFCTAINHFASSHSSVQFGCEPYMDDIQAALREFSHSTLTGRTVLNPEGRQEVVDWTGLLETLYPGLSGNDYLEEAWTTLPGWFSPPLFPSLSNRCRHFEKYRILRNPSRVLTSCMIG